MTILCTLRASHRCPRASSGPARVRRAAFHWPIFSTVRLYSGIQSNARSRRRAARSRGDGLLSRPCARCCSSATPSGRRRCGTRSRSRSSTRSCSRRSAAAATCSRAASSASRVERALPGAELLDYFAFGFKDLVERGMSFAEAERETVARAVAALGIDEAVVPGDLPLALGDRLRAGGVTLTVDDAAVDAAAAGEVARPSSTASARPSARPRRRWRRRATCSPVRCRARTAGCGSTAGRCWPRTSAPRCARPAPRRRPVPARRDRRLRVAGLRARAGQRAAPAGLPIQVDLWPRHEATACWADMARTFLVGDPAPELAGAARRAGAAHAQPCSRPRSPSIRPGVTGRALYDAACDALRGGRLPTQRTGPRGRGRGLPVALGHGVGLDPHEAPSVGLAGHERCSRATCWRSSRACGTARFGGVTFEDLVLVTAGRLRAAHAFPYGRRRTALAAARRQAVPAGRAAGVRSVCATRTTIAPDRRRAPRAGRAGVRRARRGPGASGRAAAAAAGMATRPSSLARSTGCGPGASPASRARSTSRARTATRRGRAEVSCSKPSATSCRGTSRRARSVRCGLHAWHPTRASARRVCGLRGAVPGILEAAGAVEVHADGFRAARGGRHALVLLPRGNARLLERLAASYDAELLRLDGPDALLEHCRARGLGLAPGVVAGARRHRAARGGPARAPPARDPDGRRRGDRRARGGRDRGRRAPARPARQGAQRTHRRDPRALTAGPRASAPRRA